MWTKVQPALHCGKTVLCSVQKGIYKASVAQRWMAELQEWKEILHPGILHSRHQLGRSTHSSDPWEIALFIGHSSPCNFVKVREVLGNLGTTNTLSFSLIHQYMFTTYIVICIFLPFNCHLFFFKIQYTLFLWIWYFLYKEYKCSPKRGLFSFIGFGSFVWFLASSAFFCFASFVPLLHLLPSSNPSSSTARPQWKNINSLYASTAGHSWGCKGQYLVHFPNIR